MNTMVSLSKLEKDILKDIRPNKDQKSLISSYSTKALTLANKYAKKYKGKAILAGSITRETWLPDKMEFDVFILLPENLNQKNFERAGLDIGKKVIESLKGKYELRYAQHPYVTGKINGVSIDIVPAYKVDSAEKIKSAVDRTPFHVEFVNKKLPSNLANDVLLLKKMLKNIRTYGADTKTEGFSGYVCELLIIHYKGFGNLMKAISKWEIGEVIDIENNWKKEEYDKLHDIFYGQPIIIIDPTDKNRNTAAALSGRNFMLIKKLASDYVKKPTRENFIKEPRKPINGEELKEKQQLRNTQFLFLKFLPPKGVDDVTIPQMRKFAERVQGILEEDKYEFKVMNKDVFTDGSYLSGVFLEMEISKLPLIQKRHGPSIFDKEGSNNFIKKYMSVISGPYVENKNWVIEINRPFITASDKIRDSLAKTGKELLEKGIPKLVADRLLKGFDVVTNLDTIVTEIERNENFGIFLRKFFEKEKLI